MGFSHSDIDMRVLGQINQRTLVGGAAIDTGPIAKQIGISVKELAESLERLRAKDYIALESGARASITPGGHVSLS